MASRSEMRDGARLVITIHPPTLLRMDDEAAKEDVYREFVKDLRAAAKLGTKSAA